MHWTKGRRALVEVLQRRRYGYVHVPKEKPPHLLGFGSEWRKCFVVHPHTQVAQPLERFQVITGTIVEKGLPSDIQTEQLMSTEIRLFEERLETAVYESGLLKWGTGKKGVEKLRNVFSSALLGVWMSGADHLRTGSLTMDPRVESYWRCDRTNFLCITKPLFILHCTKPLPLFTDPLNTYDPLPFPLGDPRHLGLFQHSFDQITPFSGCHRYSPTGYSHTLFAADLRLKSRDQILANGLIHLFSQSAAECIQNGYPLHSHLSHPLSLLGIVVSESHLTFLAFQLNTLNIKKEQYSGPRNILWAGPTLNMMSGRHVNMECFQLLWQFLNVTPTRNRPRLSGFQLQ